MLFFKMKFYKNVFVMALTLERLTPIFTSMDIFNNVEYEYTKKIRKNLSSR